VEPVPARGIGLTNLEYAPLAELRWAQVAPEAIKARRRTHRQHRSLHLFATRARASGEARACERRNP
jgi:hypothetical protein